MTKSSLALSTLFFLLHTDIASAQEFSMCMDPRFATRIELSPYKNLMYDAFSRAGHKLKVTPMLWDECHELVQQGKFDGAIPSSYNDERASYMYYPDDANQINSKWSVAKLDYVLVTKTESNFHYNGDPRTIPQPAMVPTGHEVLVGRLLKLNPTLTVLDTEANDKRNLSHLLRGEKGSVVMIKNYADILLARSLYKGRVEASTTPVFTVAYFLPFSKRTNITKAQMQKIWDTIYTLKNDPQWLKANSIQDRDD